MRYFQLFLFVIFSFASSAQDKDPYLLKVKSSSARRSLKDSVLVNKLNKISLDSSYTNAQKGADYAREAIAISSNIEFYKGQVIGYFNLGAALIYQNDYDSAMICANKALDIAKRYHFDLLVVKAIDLRGSVYSYQGEYDKACSEYFNALGKAEKIHEKHTMKSYANMGYVFFMLSNLNKSRKYCEIGYELGTKYHDTAIMVSTINLLALADKRENKTDKALSRFGEGLKLARATNSVQRQAQILYNMSNIYFDRKEYDKGFELFNESLELSKRNDSYLSVAIGFQSLAENYTEIGRLKEALLAADSALYYGGKTKNHEIMMESYNVKSQIMKKMNKPIEALFCLELAYNYKDSLNLGQLNDAVIDSEDNYKKGKRQMADSLKTIQDQAIIDHNKKIDAEKLKSRELLIWVFACVLVLVVIGLYFLKKNNAIVKRQNKVVNQQNEEIQLQHKEITDSITYAQRIQDAIISKEGEWQKISGEHFILFKPKDVVSGDFYWAFNDQEKNLAIWALADCTGHGVPGAFMSVLGTGFLNEIVIENGNIDPGIILDLLRTKVVSALTQKGEAKTKDGMDISICVWDKSTNKLSYAGANNPLWIVRHKSSTIPEEVKRVIESDDSAICLLEIAPDKMPVGYQFTTPPPFSTKTVDVQLGDLFVLISDGFADQFGGENGKKFKSLTLKKLILDNQGKSMESQKIALEQAFENWKSDEEQVDDVCIVGVKVSSLT